MSPRTTKTCERSERHILFPALPPSQTSHPEIHEGGTYALAGGQCRATLFWE